MATGGVHVHSLDSIIDIRPRWQSANCQYTLPTNARKNGTWNSRAEVYLAARQARSTVSENPAMQAPGTSWGIYDVSVKWRLSITDLVLWRWS